MGEIITPQAQAEGSLSVYSISPSILARNLQFSFPATLLCLFLFLSLSLTHLPAMLPCSATPLGTHSNPVHILSLCTRTLPTNPDHDSISLHSICLVCVCVCVRQMRCFFYVQYKLVFNCNAHRPLNTSAPTLKCCTALMSFRCTYAYPLPRILLRD